MTPSAPGDAVCHSGTDTIQLFRNAGPARRIALRGADEPLHDNPDRPEARGGLHRLASDL